MVNKVRFHASKTKLRRVHALQSQKKADGFACYYNSTHRRPIVDYPGTAPTRMVFKVHKV